MGELKSSNEQLLSSCPWKEYTVPDTGKVYFHNTQTKESVWTIPPELAELKKKIEAENAAGGGSSAGGVASKATEKEAKSALEAAMAATLAAMEGGKGGKDAEKIGA